MVCVNTQNNVLELACALCGKVIRKGMRRYVVRVYGDGGLERSRLCCQMCSHGKKAREIHASEAQNE